MLLYQWIHEYGQAKHNTDVYPLWISNGCRLSNLNGYTLWMGNLIPSLLDWVFVEYIISGCGLGLAATEQATCHLRLRPNQSIISTDSSQHSWGINDYDPMLQWFIPDGMRCCQSQTTMTSWDNQNHIRDTLGTKKWIYLRSVNLMDLYESTLTLTTLCALGG